MTTMTTPTLRSLVPLAEAALAALHLAEPVTLENCGAELMIGDVVSIMDDEEDPDGRYSVVAWSYHSGTRETPPEWSDRYIGSYPYPAEAITEAVLVVARGKVEAALPQGEDE